MQMYYHCLYCIYICVYSLVQMNSTTILTYDSAYKSVSRNICESVNQYIQDSQTFEHSIETFWTLNQTMAYNHCIHTYNIIKPVDEYHRTNQHIWHDLQFQTWCHHNNTFFVQKFALRYLHTNLVLVWAVAPNAGECNKFIKTDIKVPIFHY